MISDRFCESEGVPSLAWEKVRGLACDYVNAVLGGAGDYGDALRRKMLRTLNRMIKKYGKCPSILATKADYYISDKMRAKLLEEAFVLANKFGDNKNVTLISSSLAELYMDDIMDFDKGVKWVGRLGMALQNYPDDTEQQVFERLYARAKEAR